MPYTTYWLLHLLGILMTFTALGAVCVRAAFAEPGSRDSFRRFAGFLHGGGLLLVLVGGFGMLARLPGLGWPGWLIAKLVIWVALGIGPLIPAKARAAAAPMLLVFPLLGFLAAMLAQTKPF